MTIKVSICNLDHHRQIRVTQCGISETGHPTGTRTPVWINPLTAVELYVHQHQMLEVEEVKP